MERNQKSGLDFSAVAAKCQRPLLLCAGAAPLPLLLLAGLAPAALPYWFIPPLCCAALCAVCLLLPGKARLAAGTLAIAAQIALSLWLLPWQSAWQTLLIPLAFTALTCFVLPTAAWPRERELPVGLCAACLAMHLAAQLFVNANARLGDASPYAPIAAPLVLCFILFAALWALALNRESLVGAMAGNRAAPLSIRRRNRLLTLGALALALVLSAVPAIINAIVKAWYFLRRVVEAVIAFITSLLPQQTETAPGGGGGSMDMLGGLESQEPSAFAQLMEKIFMALAYLLLAGVAVLLAIFLFKKLRKLFRRLIERLRSFAAAATEDYVDEAVDTREPGDARRAMLAELRRRARARRPQAGDSPRERIRGYYLRLRLRHPQWAPSRTARESLPPDAAVLYERARYSAHPVTSEDAKRFDEQAKGV